MLNTVVFGCFDDRFFCARCYVEHPVQYVSIDSSNAHDINQELPLQPTQLQRQMQHAMTKLPSLRKPSSPNVHLQRLM